jgi:hypothetical protein
MRKIFHKPLLALPMLFLTCTVYAGTLADTTKKDTTKYDSYFKLSADYTSNNVFMGRTPKTTTPIISPEAKYAFSWGLYVSGTADYLPDNKKNNIDGGDATLGYDFDITDNLSGSASYTKLFYNVNSTQVGSSISSDFNASLDYDIGDIITPSITGDYDINKQGINNDEFAGFSLSHDIIFEKLFGDKDLILISPTVGLNAGTQNFYDAYLTRKVLKNAKRTAAQNALIANFEQNVNQFKLLDYELSLPVEYKAGHFILQFTPEYAIAENKFKSAAIAKALGVSDENTVFYFTAGVGWKF